MYEIVVAGRAVNFLERSTSASSVGHGLSGPRRLLPAQAVSRGCG
jgi:hypothetical protein